MSSATEDFVNGLEKHAGNVAAEVRGFFDELMELGSDFGVGCTTFSGSNPPVQELVTATALGLVVVRVEWSDSEGDDAQITARLHDWGSVEGLTLEYFSRTWDESAWSLLLAKPKVELHGRDFDRVGPLAKAIAEHVSAAAATRS
jgi:hypothetical protein